MHVGLGQGLVGWTLQHRQSVLVPDVKKDPRFLSHIGDQIQFETRDLLAVPLIVRGGSFGVLEAVNKKDGTFTNADVTWLEVLASLAAAGIANAQSFRKLQQRTTELEIRNQELDTFAHTVAHDLQNPLALIIGFAEVLEKEHADLSPDEMQGPLRTIAQTGRKMDNIINELILLAQIREAEIQVYSLNMAQIVDAALERLAYTIDEKQAEIIKPAPSAWPVALGYAPWIEEVWVNYISNALKYGGRPDEGIPPHIELGFSTEEVEPADQRGGKSTQSHSTRSHIRFWVGDNGRGLTVEEQTKLFKPFTRLMQIQAKGHGLGLSIVRRIMDKLHGKVGIESEVERGSYFYFTLPHHNDQPATTPPEKTRIIEDIPYSTTDKLKENVVPLPG
jgi:signal transduction histidine kinase